MLSYNEQYLKHVSILMVDISRYLANLQRHVVDAFALCLTYRDYAPFKAHHNVT